MKKSLNFFETKKIDNQSLKSNAGEKTPTAGGSITTCDGHNYIYGSDTRHSNWIFKDTITYDWIDGNP